MAKRQVVPQPQTLDAARTLGAQIRMARHERGWTAADLAARIGEERLALIGHRVRPPKVDEADLASF